MQIFEITKSFVITWIYPPRKAVKAEAYYKFELLSRLTGERILKKSYVNIIKVSQRVANTLIFK